MKKLEDNSRTLRVFLCHSSADKQAVRILYKQLCAEGFDPWLDEIKLLPGQKWQQEIPKAVEASDVVIVCLSQGSINKKGYVQKEIKYALDVADQQPEDAIFLIPVKLEECIVPGRLSEWHWVNLFESDGYEKLLLALRYRANTLGTVLTKYIPNQADIDNVIAAIEKEHSVDVERWRPILPKPGKITARNTSRYVGEERWDWTVFIDTDRDTLSQIEYVEYTLHPTFPKPKRMVRTSNNNFALKSNGWGIFEIKIRVKFWDGTEKNLSHMLEFH